MKTEAVTCLCLAIDYDKIKDVIQQRFGPNITIDIISKTDLAELSLLQSLQKLRGFPGKIFCIACRTLEKRPRLFVLKVILLISGKRQAYIIDETGRIISRSWPGFLLIDLPKVIWELAVSLFVMVVWLIFLYFFKLWVK